MTVYYQYDKNGLLQSTSTTDPSMGPTFSHNVNHYLEQGDIVGAYLAQRATIYPAQVFPVTYHGKVPQNDGMNERDMDTYHYQRHTLNIRHHAGEQNKPWAWKRCNRPHLPRMPVDIAAAPQAQSYYYYPHPDDVRHLHFLYSLLPLIDPARRFNCLDGQMIDIVEEGTRNVLCHAVHKKLLVLFLGRTTIARLLVSPYPLLGGNQKLQHLVMPRGLSSKSAWTILIAWMKRATLPNYVYDIEQFRVPHNLFAACTLAQTLSFVGLHKDAYRVDMTVSENHYVRPMYAAELEALWNNLGPDNRYTCAAIRMTKKQLQDYRCGVSRKGWIYDDIMQLLEVHSAMKVAVMSNDGEDQNSSLAVGKSSHAEA